MYPEEFPVCPSCGHDEPCEASRESVWGFGAVGRFFGWDVDGGVAFACQKCGHLIVWEIERRIFRLWPKDVHLSCLPALHA